jgi:predicted dehydrogenase/uncharacterized membrane protein YphA (DoxX/SURF4 family)
VTRAQQSALVVLRTLIGWHFAYEGWWKIVAPGWSSTGAPVPRWTSAGYLGAASGPLAGLFHGLATSRLLAAVDATVPIVLLAAGLGLIVGLLTRVSAIAALVLLALFYLSAIPTSGVHEPGAEGAYLLVNKNLIEAAAVAVLLRALAGTPALAALGAAAAIKGPVRGGPVRLGFIGLGGEGRVLLTQTDGAFGEVRALCDINPAHLAKADEVLSKAGKPPARHYEDWREMLQKEDLEAVVLAPPLWLHAEIAAGCLEAGKHVLCEKMMAWDEEGCRRMQQAAHKAGRLLEIGYQRFYNPVYQATYEGIIKPGVLGDVYHARLVWHRNQNWRRKEDPPAPDYDPSRWGYPSFDHLLNWRLYWRYSKGLLAELASHQVNVANWFFGTEPASVTGSGGVYRWKDGREVEDHIYVTFDYPQGRTAVFSSIESNSFDDYYEMFMGTRATLILKREVEAYLFEEGSGRNSTGVEVTAKTSGPALEASETRPVAGRPAPAAGTVGGTSERQNSYRLEISEFCAAVRVGRPLRCGPEKAMGSARACLAAHEAVQKKARVVLA